MKDLRMFDLKNGCYANVTRIDDLQTPGIEDVAQHGEVVMVVKCSDVFWSCFRYILGLTTTYFRILVGLGRSVMVLIYDQTNDKVHECEVHGY